MKLGPGLSFSWKRALGVTKSVGLRIVRYGLVTFAVLLVLFAVVFFAIMVVEGLKNGREPDPGDTYSTAGGNFMFLIVIVGTVVALFKYEKNKKLKASQKIED